MSTFEEMFGMSRRRAAATQRGIGERATREARRQTYFIAPRNEGQDLNYIETCRGTYSQCMARARSMSRDLSRVLREGDISVEIRDANGKSMAFVTPSGERRAKVSR